VGPRYHPFVGSADRRYLGHRQDGVALHWRVKAMNDLPLQILAWTFGSLGAIVVVGAIGIFFLERQMKK
jgi:hypothetical protein